MLLKKIFFLFLRKQNKDTYIEKNKQHLKKKIF